MNRKCDDCKGSGQENSMTSCSSCSGNGFVDTPDITKPDLWCIQVINDKRDVLDEHYVHMRVNEDYKFPEHGKPATEWLVIDKTAVYHLTPFKWLSRDDYLNNGKVK